MCYLGNTVIIIIITQLELCVVYLTWYLTSWINETSLTICQHIQLAMEAFQQQN